MKTNAEKVATYDKKLIERGGRKLNCIRLQPEAAEVLAKFEAAGVSATAIINALLVKAGG
jgi:hypothetical protein